jgi:hypothetical protein
MWAKEMLFTVNMNPASIFAGKKNGEISGKYKYCKSSQ